MKKQTNHEKSYAFTLIEILIVVAILIILAGTLLTANIKSTLQKARDSKRKQDLNKLARHLEDYYNDNDHYPPTDLNGSILGADWGEKFFDYNIYLPKDPLSPSYRYYYVTDPTVQNFYALYARLENQKDPDIEIVGCLGGCGPNRAFNYTVHSPNIIVINDGDPESPLNPMPTKATTPIPTPTYNPGPVCIFGGCGFCDKCGGEKDCGTDRRCTYDGKYWKCQLDAGCE